MRMRYGAGGGLLLALVLWGAGCGGKPVQIEGIVTLDGKPVSGAMVNFVPEGGKGVPATGFSDSDGVFRLTTYSPEDGAFPGDYKVIVIKTEAPASSSNMTPETIKSMMTGGGKKAAPKDSAGKKPASKEDGHKQGIAKDAAGKEPAPKDGAAKEPAPKDGAGKEPVPKDDAGKELVPKDDAGKQWPPRKPSLLPEVYSSLTTTTLRVTLPPKGRVVLELHSGGQS